MKMTYFFARNWDLVGKFEWKVGSWWKKGWLFGCFLRTKSEKMS